MISVMKREHVHCDRSYNQERDFNRDAHPFGKPPEPCKTFT